MKLERLDHFGIEVNELVAAERFYTEVLGLTVVAHLGDQTLLQCGPQNLALFQIKRPPLRPNNATTAFVIRWARAIMPSRLVVTILRLRPGGSRKPGLNMQNPSTGAIMTACTS